MYFPKNIIKKYFPKIIISTIIYIIYFPRDIIDLLLGRRDPLIPPTRLMFDGPRNISTFKKNGKEFLRYYIKLCNLKPNEKILDIGCGIGRKTVFLTKYLDENGRYEGFDIVKVGIEWCRKRISSKYPNFHFQLVDVFNNHYNPKGKYRASEYRFPFENESFDIVVLGSVFTHMLPEDMENYFSEIVRVLKKGGRCLITFFLLNRESFEFFNPKKSQLNFKYKMGKYRTININMPEDAVCYDESYVLSIYEKYGLVITQSIHYGSWFKRQDFLSFQDIIIATKLKF
jgi:ubiquinone/menaquinone biosynthesis C-methylase UbiE